MESIVQATRDACIHESIASFPDGYETIVGERGVTLSGGQKQRSSIARALLKNAPILIAHRISTIQNADIIMVLEDGTAKEIGTHAELLAQNGIYRDMFEQQQLEAARQSQTEGLQHKDQTLGGAHA